MFFVSECKRMQSVKQIPSYHLSATISIWCENFSFTSHPFLTWQSRAPIEKTKNIYFSWFCHSFLIACNFFSKERISEKFNYKIYSNEEIIYCSTMQKRWELRKRFWRLVYSLSNKNQIHLRIYKIRIFL